MSGDAVIRADYTKTLLPESLYNYIQTTDVSLDHVQYCAEKFLQGAAHSTMAHPVNDLFTARDLLDRDAATVAGFDTTVAMLRSACNLLREKEEQLLKQEERIARLEQLVIHDELTCLKNRRGFYQAFEVDMERCHRGHTEGGLLALLDLDNFKDINDTYGHAAGDACLRLFARTLEQQIRSMDTAGRLGGDEFVLLLSNTTKTQAVQRLQVLVKRLNNLSMAWEGEIIPVRASLGLKEYNAQSDIADIFSAADDELYDNKRIRKGEAPL